MYFGKSPVKKEWEYRHKNLIAMYFICIKHTDNSYSLIVEQDTSNILI